MTRLSPMDLDLLDFLCICAEKKIKVVRIKAPRLASLRRLREAGQVAPDDYLPSAPALLRWIERQKTRSEAATRARVPDEPPAPKAAVRGDGDARKVAPSPKRKPKVSSRQREETPRSVGCDEGTGGGAKPVPDEASPTLSIPSTKGPHPLAEPPAVAPTADESAVAADEPNEPRPAFEEAGRPVDLKVNARRRTSRSLPCSHANEGQTFQRQVQRAMRTNRANAEAFLDSGKTSAQATSVSLKIEARKVELARIETARLEDPVEQAKTIIRRAGWVCFSAIISGGPVGKFYIGTRLVTEAQLLAQAEQLRARRRVG